MVKLTLIVAIGVAVTMVLGIGQPKEADRLAKLSQAHAGHSKQAPAVVKAAEHISLDETDDGLF
jgi:hypothetical protein